jgi:diguanylate cyclase (GGDEF)-like protein
MGTVPRNPSTGADSDLAADAELLRAVLAAFQHLELEDLCQALLDPALAWSGPGWGLALGPAEDRRKFVPLIGSLPRSDPRWRLFHGIDPARLRKELGDGVRSFHGLGPLAELAADWPADPPGACVALPLLGPSDRWAGALLLFLERAPEPLALERLARLRDVVRPAVGHALHVLAMRELMIKDDTAQCYNRRYFEEFLPEELARASRFRAPLSLIFLDMDNLKEVNTSHGHAMGSRTLFEVSVRIRSKIRRFDKLFRFGGDEFCIVLPETEWHGAMEVAERVRDAVASKPFLLREVGKDGVRMTASLGVASFPLHARNQQELIEQADRAMQRIKHETKNSIGIAEAAGD